MESRNIYGIIFGASHPLAVEKFLTTAWKRNAVNGEANFDIDDDAAKAQLTLFDEKKPTKKEAFANLLKDKLLKKDLVTNEDVYLFTLDQGHIPSHAADVLKQLKKEGLLTYDNPSPLVTYEQVFKNHRIINYKLR